ncbi:hypothetical protein SBA1_140116 [Candidatus Sulfotelmatobacter kueseliae]|uniref:Plasmid maintenance system killer n=1 Tax=Candidatus Sulfotelmatobacter kueseliae TaxID=2042962 RepID=A0A2U3K6D1_9BACT|nr:hypothetical protein SBA1_140116 [Candidatus Sulfotelmatobacter kueseliae]
MEQDSNEARPPECSLAPRRYRRYAGEPPGKAPGDLAGLYSIRVNDQYRIVFRFSGATCSDVRCTDYH